MLGIVWALIRAAFYLAFLAIAIGAGAYFGGLLGALVGTGFMLVVIASSESTYSRRRETERLLREMRRGR